MNGRQLFYNPVLEQTDPKYTTWPGPVDPAPADQANLVGSSGADGLHHPVVDLDVPAFLVPSSTPGHSHLYINVAVPWEGYLKLLDVLAELGIVEPAYVSHSKEQGQTLVRVPWVRKAAS